MVSGPGHGSRNPERSFIINMKRVRMMMNSFNLFLMKYNFKMVFMVRPAPRGGADPEGVRSGINYNNYINIIIIYYIMMYLFMFYNINNYFMFNKYNMYIIFFNNYTINSYFGGIGRHDTTKMYYFTVWRFKSFK
uniref:Putative uncharacterized protein Q0182, mitochondrial n=1 Tax=Saccharomyces cerevisiae (strain ATCC 204508 / S288c) TaxID=559292 RepID=Q0182_YEAST|nr:RecName: Full=Putative uncharacterized protein Q0182, mitochondrial [Saccharomyces cerevisiae S288C]